MFPIETAEKIKSMEIRGAGRIARAAAEALRAQALCSKASFPLAFVDEMERAAELLVSTRPTAVSLPNAVHMVMVGIGRAKTVEEARTGVVERADTFIQSSQHAVEKIAEFGARHIRDGDMILTHCNSEVALGCIIEAHRSGKEIEVFATDQYGGRECDQPMRPAGSGAAAAGCALRAGAALPAIALRR